MSRRIDTSRPFTEEEREWLLTRAYGKEKIAQNDAVFGDLSEAKKKRLQERAADDDEKEAALNPPPPEDDEDEYHPEDLARVEQLTIKDLRLALAKAGLRDTVTKADVTVEGGTLTEKQVLGYRLLDHLDEVRKGRAAPEPDKEVSSE